MPTTFSLRLALWALLGSAHGYRNVARAELPAALLDVVEQQFQEAHHG